MGRCANPTCPNTWDLINTENQYCFALGCASKHIICVPCFSTINAARGCNPFCICPACHVRITQWDISGSEVRSETTRHGGKRKRIVTKIDKAKIKKPRLNDAPLLYHSSTMDDNIFRKTAVLSFSFPVEYGGSREAKSKKYHMNSISVELIQSDGEDHSECWSEETKDKIEAIFQLLNKYLVPSLLHQANCSGYMLPGGDTFDKIAINDATKSLLHRCVYALGRGETVQERKNDGQRWMNLLCKSYAATNIISHLANERVPSKLKNVVSGQLLAHGASKPLWKILSKIGVAPSSEFARIEDVAKSMNTLMMGLETDPHDLLLLLYDNIGFKRGGSSPGYDQFTAMQITKIPKTDLQKWKVYPAIPGGPCLSQERKVWAEIRENVSFEEVLGVTVDDTNILASSVLPPIKLLLKMEVQGELPSYNEARAMISDNSSKNITWPIQVPQELGVRKIVADEGASSSQINTVSHVADRIDDGKEKFATNLDANNSIVDRPMQKDLNAKETVRTLMKYAIEMAQKSMGQEVEDEFWKEVPKIMSHTGAILCGDGSPTYAMTTLLRKDREGAKEFVDLVKAYSGGFHMILEGHRKFGAIFGPTHLKDIISSWRTSKGQLKWVLEPGDPNQINAELVMIILALYVSAIRSKVTHETKLLQSEISHPPQNTQKKSFKLSPADIVDFMIERADDEPLVLVILMEMRFAELSFMLHEAEKKSDASIYLTVTKYLAPFFACTHATHYVSMITDFFVDWYCASDADKVIFAKAIMTRRTKDRKTIFTDRFVEWMMRDLRSWLGKTASVNTPTLLERVALNLNERKKNRVAGENECKSEFRKDKCSNDTSSSKNIKFLEFDHVFCEVLVFAEEANIWGPGPLRHISSGPSRTRGNDPMARARDYERDEFTTICDAKIKLNTELLSLLSIGNERLQKYFTTFLKKGDLNDPKRSEIEVSLESIDPFFSKADKNSKKDLERATTMNHDTLKDCYTVDGLKGEIKYLNDLVGNDKQKKYSSKANKNDLIFIVQCLHKELMDLDPEWADRRTAAIETELRDREMSEEGRMKNRIETELKNPFFTLDGAEAKSRHEDDSIEFILSITDDDENGNANGIVCDDEENSHNGLLCFNGGSDDDEEGGENIQHRPPLESIGMRAMNCMRGFLGL